MAGHTIQTLLDKIVHMRTIYYMLLSFSVLVAASMVKNLQDSCDVQAVDGGKNTYYSFKVQ